MTPGWAAEAPISPEESGSVSPIARAMLKNAPVVILDEATAYIDPENEAVVQQGSGKTGGG